MRQALRYILLLVMTITTSKAMAQADAQFTQYWAVQNYYNAAATGTSDFINIRGGTRQQWVGIEGAPKSFLVTAESPFKFLGKRFGAGLIMHQESIGLYRTLNIDLQLSYKIKLFKGQLSAGVQFGYIDQTFKGSEVRLPDGSGGSESDDSGSSGSDYDEGGSGSSTGTNSGIPSSDVRGGGIDFAFGLHYTHKYFWAGISATHLSQPSLGLKAEGDEERQYESKLGRMYYFMAGSNIPIKNTLFELQPSVLIRSDFKVTQADITARVRYKKMFSAGIAYRTNDAISAMLAVEIKNFFVGYSYDYAISDISKVSNGSHEIFAGYKLKLNLGDKNKNKHKSIRIM